MRGHMMLLLASVAMLDLPDFSTSGLPIIAIDPPPRLPPPRLPPIDLAELLPLAPSMLGERLRDVRFRPLVEVH